MTTYPLFKFANDMDIDWTPCIVMGSYRVNRKPKYDTWTDATDTEHRCVSGRKVNGTFTMLFNGCHIDNDGNLLNGMEQYLKFLDQLLLYRNSNESHDIVVYINNENVFEPIEAFIDIDPINEIPYMNAPGDAKGFEVTIQER